MDLSFWEAALILIISFITVCVLYYWCTSKCYRREDIETDIENSTESSQGAQAIFTITTVLMGDSRTAGQQYSTTCTNTEFIVDDHPPTYEEAVRRVMVS